MADPFPQHDHEKLFFPKNFLWGAATSAHQVEGSNINNNWWTWEQKVQSPHKRSGKSINQYELYETDFNWAQKLGHNAHRLSIEWSRIEPQQGMFNQDAIDHYVDVLKALKSRGMTVMLTLHHFTDPIWFAQKGGWENFNAPFDFENFLRVVIPQLQDYVDLWITINEPNVLTYQSYLIGDWPPQKRSRIAALKVMWNLSRAHIKAYHLIHQFNSKAKVGIANNVASFDTFHKHHLLEEISEWFLDVVGNHYFYILTGKTHDFLGLNYYMNQYISLTDHSRFPRIVDKSTTIHDISDMGWEIHPEGIFNVIMDVSDYKLPIYITENGVATTNDDRRVRFLIAYLKEIFHAIKTGADVRGYFHWSLIDNFEWAYGYEPKFGLIAVDYKTERRLPKPSAYVYQEIIKNNGIPHYLLKLLGHSIKVKEVIGPNGRIK